MKIWVDANPKKVAYVREDEVCEMNEILRPATNNEAEYMAILFALRTNRDVRDIEIFSDSRIAVEQLNHNWHIKNKNLRRLAEAVWKLVAERNRRECTTTFINISRKQNKAGKMLG